MTGRWSFKEKSDGTLKARWCARGFSEPFADNTYADVLPPTTMRLLLAFAACKNLHIRHIDITAAFLHADIDRPLYIEQPHGKETAANFVCKLHKAIGQSKDAKWWTQDCGKAHRDLCRSRRLGICSTAVRRSFNKAVKKAKRDYWSDKIESVSNLPDAYKITGWHKKVAHWNTPPLEGPDGPVVTPQAKAQIFHSTLLSRHSDFEDIPDDVPSVPKQNLPWPPLTDDEIYRSCCQVTSSAPGPDEITVTALRQAWPIIGARVAALFRQCDQLGHHPLPFKKANVVIIP
ncbi:hypothetical protein K3495_g16323, partial [Podosphaera aphanis]